MKSKIAVLLLLFLVILAIDPAAMAQNSAPENPNTPSSALDKKPEDALNRGTPRGSIVGFMQACANFDFEKAAQFMDLSNLPDEISEIGGAELARQFNQVLSRAVWLDDYSVNDSPEGLKGDGLPNNRDELVRIVTGEREVVIWMQRVPRGDGEMIWKISNRSIPLIPELYAQFSYPPVIENIRSWFPPDVSFLHIEAWKWFVVLVSAILCWPLFYLIGRSLTALISSPEKELYPFVRKVLTGPLVAIAILLFASLVINRLGIGVYAQKIMDAHTLITLAVLWAIWSILNLYKRHKQASLAESGRPGAANLMRPITTFAKLLVLIVGMLFWLSNLGVNITTLIAGLGVGGLAIALALQKPLEDMMGALSIFSQVPIRVGDFCSYAGISGVVEEIGLRTTRLRTPANTIVSIPNSRIAYTEIENISSREKIRYWPTLRLRYDSTPDQLRKVINNIKEMLEQHAKVYDDPVRVRFTDFHEDAILIKLHCFLKTTDFSESLEIGEALNFDIMDIVHHAGASFALPGRTIHVDKEPGAFMSLKPS